MTWPKVARHWSETTSRQQLQNSGVSASCGPNRPTPQRYLGTALEKKGDTEAAVAAYRKAVELNAADAVAAQSLERLTKAATPQGDPHIAEFERLIREGKFAEVEPLLAEYVTQQPGSSWGWYALGYSQFAQQKIGASIKALAKSLELDLTQCRGAQNPRAAT